MDTSAETLQETCPLCKKDFGEGNPSNICKILKKGADKVNKASHKKGRDDFVVAEGSEYTNIIKTTDFLICKLLCHIQSGPKSKPLANYKKRFKSD